LPLFGGEYVLALRFFPGYLSTMIEKCALAAELFNEHQEFELIFNSMVNNGFLHLLNADVVQFNHQVWRRVISLMRPVALFLRTDAAGMNMVESLGWWGYGEILLQLFDSGKVELRHLWNVAPNKTHSPFVSACMRRNDENVLPLVRTLAPQLEEMYGTDFFKKTFFPNGTSYGTDVVFRPNITVAGILAISDNFDALVHMLIRHISFVLRTVTLVNRGFADVARNRNVDSFFSPFNRHLPSDVCKHIGKQCVATVGIGGNLRAVLEGMQDTSASARKILEAMDSADDLRTYRARLNAMKL
jgi:hypothetical protein